MEHIELTKQVQDLIVENQKKPIPTVKHGGDSMLHWDEQFFYQTFDRRIGHIIQS